MGRRRMIGILFCLITALRTTSAATVDFSREILPLLSDYCFQCHGPDPKARKADLRLDDEANVKLNRDGRAVVFPGQSSRSELLKRLLTGDPDDKMPPPKLGRSLSTAQIEKVRRWIDEGAKWGPHWALAPVKRPKAPPGAKHPVDGFIDNRLRADGLKAQPRATRQTLIRRLHLDLTGLPPGPDEVNAFLADQQPDAWKRLVRRVLDKPAYGERMAWNWLDASRYADSNGYQGDMERTMWPWRDWVVKAFNENLPWDQFTIWQLAGDLLPNATFEQKLATGFNRNHMINGEGGRIPDENRVDYVMDMAETMGTIWLGMTFTCSRCHDHKFDAITQKDYYSLFAFFNQTPVDGGGRSPQTPPVLEAPTGGQQKQIGDLDRRITTLNAQLNNRTRELASEQTEWEKEILANQNLDQWETLKPISAKAEKQTLKILDDASVLAGGTKADNDTYTIETRATGKMITAFRLEALKHASLYKGGLSRADSGNFVLTGFEIRTNAKDAKPLKFASALATFEQGNLKARAAFDGNPKTGWAVWEGRTVDREHAAVFVLKQPLKLSTNDSLTFTLRHDSEFKQHVVGRFRISATENAKPVPGNNNAVLAAAINAPIEKRTGKQKTLIAEAHQATDSELGKIRNQLEAAKKKRAAVLKQVPRVMVMEDIKKPRETFILTRGLYNKPGTKVTAAVPASLPALPAGANADRLGLARWLVAKDNPLAARVTVNRFWQMLFGVGIVKTAEDFGVQGEFPKHPELLDWLAAEFVESGWDVKHLLEVILTSEAYQRSSTVTPELLERDPENRLLARGARFRMPSWMIRDQALAASGLLNDTVGGAPVNGYQPDGIWEEATFGKKKYTQDHGDQLYRRSIYTFWRRIIGPTMFFDSATRQVCSVKTPRTNTPLHALSTLNDVTYVEAARALAERTFKATGNHATDADRLRHAHRLVLAREPDARELKIWLTGLERSRAQFKMEAKEAALFLKNGESKSDQSLDAIEHAALAAVCLGILNTDEALTKE